MAEEDVEKLLKALKRGCPPRLACGLVGLTWAEFNDMLEDDGGLRRRLMQMEAEGKVRIFNDLRKQSQLGNVAASKFLLERVAPDEFGPPKQVLESRRVSVDLNKPLANASVPMDLSRLTKEEIINLQQLQQKSMGYTDAELLTVEDAE